MAEDAVTPETLMREMVRLRQELRETREHVQRLEGQMAKILAIEPTPTKDPLALLIETGVRKLAGVKLSNKRRRS